MTSTDPARTEHLAPTTGRGRWPLLGVYVLMGEYALWNARVADDPLPLAPVADWVSMFGFGVYFFVLPLLPLLFPDGRAPGTVTPKVAARPAIGPAAASAAEGMNLDTAVYFRGSTTASTTPTTAAPIVTRSSVPRFLSRTLKRAIADTPSGREWPAVEAGTGVSCP